MLKPLPIGVQSFRKLITGGYLYIDKTKWIYEMVKYPSGLYFLSRPRRFGKSLMVSTLEEIFLGNRDLFKGLWIDESDYQWQTHPVIRIDFSHERVSDAQTLQVVISDYLSEIAESYGLTLPTGRYIKQFRHLIRQLSAKGQVVILIDEYDKPIIDNLTNVEEAKKIRDVLKGFYTVIKAMDAQVRFVLLTGISKFSKAGVFSSLNNLSDITMSPRYSAAIGITQDELEHYFAERITILAAELQVEREELLAQIRLWYNGFCFSARCQNVYNPYSLLRFFQEGLFANYWFETGTPTFLVDLIQQKEYELPEIEKLKVDELAFSSYDIGKLNIVPLLVQTGYLTIKGIEPGELEPLYRLYYPNYEVQNAFLKVLLASFSHFPNGQASNYLSQLVRALRKKDLKRFFAVLEVFFANIPYSLQIKTERYYHSIFYMIFKLIGLSIHAEVETNQGRIDAVIELTDRVVIFEFKLDGSAQKALQQAQKTKYYQKYQYSGREVELVGVNFDSKKRTVDSFLAKTIHQPQLKNLMAALEDST